MKKALATPVLAAVLLAAVTLAAACGDGGGTTEGGSRASVRFFNGATGLTGGGGFTTNGQFASGSALAFGQMTSSCATVDAGTTSFGFGAANTGGSGLSGGALATLSSQTIPAGGNFTVVATGSAASPALFLLDNGFAGPLATNQAAVRFVNLAPGTANPFTVFTGVLGNGGVLLATDIAVGAPTTFRTVPSGANAFTILNGHDIVVSGGAATLDLQGGSVNTVAIVPNGSGGFRLVNIPRC